MKNKKTCIAKEIDLTNYIELTEAELLLVNGGKEVENSNAGVAGAQVGDTVTRKDNTTVTITQGDIDWAQAHCEGGDNSNNGGTGNVDSAGSNNPAAASAANEQQPAEIAPQGTYTQEQPTAPVGIPSNGGYNEMPVPEATQYITVDEHGNTFGEKQYGDKYVLAVPAGYAQNYLDACNAYFVGRNDGSVPGRKVDGIALTNTEGEVVHLFSTPESIEDYRKNINVEIPKIKAGFSPIVDFSGSVLGDVSNGADIYKLLTNNVSLKTIGGVANLLSIGIDICKMIDEPSFENDFSLFSDAVGFVPYCGVFISQGLNAFSSYANDKVEAMTGIPKKEYKNPYVYDGVF